MPSTEAIWSLVHAERLRQEKLVGKKFPASCADLGLPMSRKLATLMEEVGEVAEEINEIAIQRWKGAPERKSTLLFDELIQVAAVAVAWCESIRLPQLDDPGRTGPL